MNAGLKPKSLKLPSMGEFCHHVQCGSAVSDQKPMPGTDDAHGDLDGKVGELSESPSVGSVLGSAYVEVQKFLLPLMEEKLHWKETKPTKFETSI